jgi:dTMP kinase
VKKGILISFEGPEGSGKSTHLARLAAFLKAQGHSVLLTREPGGTRLAEGVRRILLDSRDGLGAMAELLLYEADRAQHVEEVLRPALRAKRLVLCDRYTDSTVAYQGAGRGLPVQTIETLNRLASGNLVPDLTLLLDVPVERGLRLARAKKKRHDRLERAGTAFHKRVRRAFLQLARREPKRFRVVLQQEDPDRTQAIIRQAVMAFLKSVRA